MKQIASLHWLKAIVHSHIGDKFLARKFNAIKKETERNAASPRELLLRCRRCRRRRRRRRDEIHSHPYTVTPTVYFR